MGSDGGRTVEMAENTMGFTGYVFFHPEISGVLTLLKITGDGTHVVPGNSAKGGLFWHDVS